ncbi:MAG TPA: cytochrome c biogenesis protein CcdA [Acidimicrobiales bacterium]|nr:cytochrome c biogenesis protein CcdA [Acidimicrobiales bacterium]
MIATLPSSLLAALPIAVAAGFVSFISPCVLPLLPGYLAFLSGATGSLEGRTGRGRAVIGAIAFIIGFAVVFVSVGALFGGFGAMLKGHERPLSLVFGSITIFLGMFFAGWWPSRWLNRERRIHHLPRVSILGAGSLGFLFALGWTPCLGPTLGAILGLEGSTADATALRGSILAFFYCLGLGIPFVVAALATEWVSTASSWLRRHQRAIGRIGGMLLIVIGILEVSGAWNTFVIWLQVHFPSSRAIL